VADDKIALEISGQYLKEETVIEFAIAQQLKLRELVAHLFQREEGQDMVEYALLAALISIVAIAIIVLIGPYLKDLFQDVVNGLATA
jgi:pilus assembly protein Flp/PilA